MSVDAPERIWVYHNGNSQTYLTAPNKFHNIEYVLADKLEELAAENEATRQDIERYIQINTDLLAENERLRRELSATTAERKRAQEACQQISEKAEAALAEKDKALKLAEFMMTKDSLCEAERLEEGLAVIRRARNAGGNDEPCRGCGDGDKVPASGYWRCPVCDAEWSGEDAE